MLVPKFKLEKTDRVYITDKYLCNGKWLLTRESAKSPVAPKSLAPLLSLKTGSYHDGIAGGWTSEQTPDMAQVIPKRDGYKPLGVAPIGVGFSSEVNISSYRYQGEGFVIGVSPLYVPLLQLGHCFAKDALSPILILDGYSLNDNLVGIVMPMRF